MGRKPGGAELENLERGVAARRLAHGLVDIGEIARLDRAVRGNSRDGPHSEHRGDGD